MKPAAVVAFVLAAVLTACSASTTATVATTAPAGTASAATTPPTTAAAAAALSTTPAHTPLWLNVKYRSHPVDVARPGFISLGGGSSSLVDAAFYDAANEYMVISLNGTAYHYCGMPSSTWSNFTGASSLGSFYEDRIKGRFDCRTGVVPQY